MSKINRQFFFEQIRDKLFRGGPNQSQIEGMGFILDVWEQHHNTKDDRWLAYALATAYHETSRTMQPIVERGGKGYLTNLYSPTSSDPNRAKMARDNGQLGPEDAIKYSGKGDVQLTWRNNYRNMGQILGVDLEAHPELALERDVAARIMFYGMENGTFRKWRFADFFSSERADWYKARDIINGDKAKNGERIAGYGKNFYAALSYTTS